MNFSYIFLTMKLLHLKRKLLNLSLQILSMAVSLGSFTNTQEIKKYNLIFGELITHGYNIDKYAFKWLYSIISTSSFIVLSLIIYTNHMVDKAIIFSIPLKQIALVVFLLLLTFNSLFFVT
jgi:hypothetical protein